jgi:hypothetical protein
MNTSSRRAWLKFSKTISFQPFCLALLTVSTVAHSAEPDLTAPQVELAAPGIWRLHFGNPEPFTPVHFRSAEMDAAGLKKMTASESMPLDVAKISFRVSDRFSRDDLAGKLTNPEWLDKVMAAIHRHWRNKNARKRQPQPA